MSVWNITFRSIDQLVTVKDCASKQEAIRAALRIARRINWDICEGDMIQCQPVSPAPAAARATSLVAYERPQKPSSARLDRSSSTTPFYSSTHTDWQDEGQSGVRKLREPQLPNTPGRGITYSFFDVNWK